MASPAVAARIATTGDGSSSSPVLDLPAGIVAGNLLVGMLNKRDLGTITWPAGWTKLIDYEVDSGKDAKGSIGYRWADGGEGGSITLSTSISDQYMGTCYRITGAENPATQAPEAASVATGDSSNPNPSTVTPTGGSKDYLFLACFGFTATDSINSPPTSYSNMIGGASASGSGGCGGASAERQLTASSDDPGTFDFDGPRQWWAGVIAIHPAGASGWTGKILGVTNPAKVNGIAVANIAKVNAVA